MPVGVKIPFLDNSISDVRLRVLASALKVLLLPGNNLVKLVPLFVPCLFARAEGSGEVRILQAVIPEYE